MIQKLKKTRLQTIILNFGPQHPAAHGILKISLSLSGETILRADPSFGLLHRGSEKLIESKTILQSVPYLDRMDYVANLFQEHSFVKAYENIFKINKLSSNVSLWRIIFDEFSRILNHLLTMGAVCLDMGSMGPIFWAFEEREQIMELYERVSGARMHTALYQPFKINGFYFSKKLINDIVFLINRGSRYVSGSFLALLNSRSMKTRLSGVGVFSKKKINNYGVTGIIARASGIDLDYRIYNNACSSNSYDYLYFKSYLGKKGDSFDRFIVRSREIVESFKIINQLILLVKPYSDSQTKTKFNSMESVISHFKSNTIFYKTSKSSTYSIIEGPKGAVSTFLILNDNQYPYRAAVRSPVSHNMNLISTFSNSTNFADFVATFCSLDVVLGEIDR